MAIKKKRGRGRPDRMSQLIYGLQDGVIKGQELFSGVYDEACELIVTVMRDPKAPAATRLNAAKTVRDVVEAALESYEEEENTSKEPEEQEEFDDTPQLLWK